MKTQLKNQYGRSMVEMIMVIAVVGVLSVASVFAGAVLLDQYTSKSALQEVGTFAVDAGAILAKGSRDISVSKGTKTAQGYGVDVSLVGSASKDDSFYVTLSNIPDKVCALMKEKSLLETKSIDVVKGACSSKGTSYSSLRFEFAGEMMSNNFAGEGFDEDGNYTSGNDDWKDNIEDIPTVCPPAKPFQGTDGQCYSGNEGDGDLPLTKEDCLRFANRVYENGTCKLLKCGIGKYKDLPYEHPAKKPTKAESDKGILYCVACLESMDCPVNTYCTQPGDNNYPNDPYTCQACSQYPDSNVIRNKDDKSCSCPELYRPYCARTGAGVWSNCMDGGKWYCVTGCTQNSDCKENEQCSCQGASCSNANPGQCIPCAEGTFRSKNGSHCTKCLPCQREENGACVDRCDDDEVCLSSSCSASSNGKLCVITESSKYATCVPKPQLIELKGALNDRMFYIPPPSYSYRMTTTEASRFCESYGYKLANLQEACLKDYHYDSGGDCHNITQNYGSYSGVRRFTSPYVVETPVSSVESCIKGEKDCVKVKDAVCLVKNGKTVMKQATKPNGQLDYTYEKDANGKTIAVPVYTNECVKTEEVWQRTVTKMVESISYRTYWLSQWNVEGSGSFWVAGNYGCTSLRVTYSCGNNHAANVCSQFYPLCTQL